MPIIAFANQKGGCAKSTTAVHYGVYLAKKGHSVIFIDADAQRSSSMWLSRLNEQKIKVEVLQSVDELLDRIPDLVNEAEYIVIDGPAGLADTTRAILLLADVAVVPVQPSPVDLLSANEAIRLINQIQKSKKLKTQENLIAGIFISRAQKGTRLMNETKQILSSFTGVELFKSVIHQKQVIADSIGQKATVWSMTGKPADDARKEYKQLFDEINKLAKKCAAPVVTPVVSNVPGAVAR